MRPRYTKIIDELDREGQVLAIIGPVGNSASDIACRHSRQKGIPSLIFSQAGLTPSENTTCFGNFLTVYPDPHPSPNGQRLADLPFRHPLSDRPVQARPSPGPLNSSPRKFGVQVIRKTAYPPEKNDFKDVVQGLKTVPCEAVLIPDTAQKAP